LKFRREFETVFKANDRRRVELPLIESHWFQNYFGMIIRFSFDKIERRLMIEQEFAVDLQWICSFCNFLFNINSIFSHILVTSNNSSTDFLTRTKNASNPQKSQLMT
jgi:hypothetical protein